MRAGGGTGCRHKPLRISGHPASRPPSSSVLPSRHKPLRISGHPAGQPGVLLRGNREPPQASSNLRASGGGATLTMSADFHRHKPLRISGHPAGLAKAGWLAAANRHKPLRISGHPARPCGRALRSTGPATSLFESQGIRPLPPQEQRVRQGPPQASSNLRASGKRLGLPWREYVEPPQASSNLRASGPRARRCVVRVYSRHKPLRISGHPASTRPRGRSPFQPATSLFESQGIRPSGGGYGGVQTQIRHKPLRISGHPAGLGGIDQVAS